MVAQWLGLRAFTAGAQVQSMVGELKPCKQLDAAKKKKERKDWVYLRTEGLDYSVLK